MTTITNAPRTYQRIKTRRAMQELLDAANATPAAENTLAQVLAAGTTNETGIAVAGIKPDDILVSVLQFDIDTGTIIDVIDVSAEVAITDDDEIQLESTNTTGDSLLVTYWSVPAED